jgi:hypothetical protein
MTAIARLYGSDSAFTAGVLLLVGLLGSTLGLWTRVGLIAA